MGGRQYTTDRNERVVDLVEGDGVSRIGEVPTAGSGTGFFAPGVGACIAGGESSNTFRRVECVDAAGEVTLLPDLAQRRHGQGMAVVDGRVYALLGGPLPSFTYSGTVQVLDLP